MGVLALSYDSDEKYMEMCDYLNANNGYWINNDVWIGCDNAFKEAEICVKDKVKTWTIADFTTFKQVRLKNEMKYFILKNLKIMNLQLMDLAPIIFAQYGTLGMSQVIRELLLFWIIRPRD